MSSGNLNNHTIGFLQISPRTRADRTPTLNPSMNDKFTNMQNGLWREKVSICVQCTDFPNNRPSNCFHRIIPLNVGVNLKTEKVQYAASANAGGRKNILHYDVLHVASAIGLKFKYGFLR